MNGSGIHACPAPDCPEYVATTLFACRAHWYVLPAEYRRRINAAWRRSDLTAHAEASAAAELWLAEHPKAGGDDLDAPVWGEDAPL